MKCVIIFSLSPTSGYSELFPASYGRQQTPLHQHTVDAGQETHVLQVGQHFAFSSQCSTTGVTKAVICSILSVG